MKCDNCDLAGDSLELLARAQGVDIDRAIRDAVQIGCLTLSTSEPSLRQIEGYKEHYVEKRRKTREMWERLSALLFPINSSMKDRLARDHLWSGRAKNFEGLKGAIGGGLRKEIIEICGKDFLPRKGFATSVAFAYQDVPGRISAIRYFGEEGIHVQNFPEPATKRAEGGLAFLDDLEPHERLVFALDNPFVTAMLCRAWNCVASRPIKAISYNNDTGAGWQTLKEAEKIVLHADRISWRLFHQAKSLERRTFIAAFPEADLGRLESRLNSWPVNDVFEKMEETAKPWRQFMVEWLTDEAREDIDVVETVNHLDITSGEKSVLLDLCAQKQRSRLEWALSGRTAAQTIYFNSKPIIQKDDGWYTPVAKNKGEEKVSDVILFFEHSQGDPRTGAMWFSGYIVYKGQRVAFRDTLAEIENDTYEWVKRKLIAANLGAPSIQGRIQRNIFDISRAFHKETYSTLHKVLGFEPSSGAIIFPQFAIRDGKFTADADFVETPGLPAQDIIPPRDVLPDLRHKLVDESDPVLAAQLAGMAAVTANILSPLNGWTKRPIGVVGSPGNLPFKAGRRLAEMFGMTSKECFKLDQEERRTLQRDAAAQGWMHYVSLNGGHLGGFNAVGADNMMVTLDKAEALALRAGGERWMLLNASDATDVPPLPSTADWLLWLAGFQARSYAGNKAVELPLVVLDDFCTWWAGRHDRSGDKLIAAAKALLELGAPAGMSLLQLFVQLYKQGELSVDRKEFYKELQNTGNLPLSWRKAAILIDEPESVVFLSRSRLIVALRRLNIPLPDTSLAEKELVKTGIVKTTPYSLDGWLIDRSAYCQVEKGNLLEL